MKALPDIRARLADRGPPAVWSVNHGDRSACPIKTTNSGVAENDAGGLSHEGSQSHAFRPSWYPLAGLSSVRRRAHAGRPVSDQVAKNAFTSKGDVENFNSVMGAT